MACCTFRPPVMPQLVCGLVAILLRAYSGFAPKTILGAGHGFIDEIGFTEHLSPTRGNGLHAMLRTIRQHAAYAARSEPAATPRV